MARLDDLMVQKAELERRLVQSLGYPVASDADTKARIAYLDKEIAAETGIETTAVSAPEKAVKRKPRKRT